MEQRYIVAIEIGSSVIKGALGVVDRNGILSVVAIETENLVDCVRYGIIQNGEEVGTRIQRIIYRLERNAALNGRRITGCYVSLGGRGLLSSVRETVRDFASEVELTADTIGRMTAEVRNTPVAEKEVIEVIPSGFSVDNLNVPNPVGTFGRLVRGRYTLLHARPVMSRNVRRVIEEKLGLRIAGTMARISAEGDLVLSADERRLGCMLVDMGAETTTIAIYKGGAMQYAATLPLGSRNITRDLTALNYTEERAEEFKKAVANANPAETQLGGGTGIDGIDYTEINNYVQARAGEIITNIIEQPRFAGLKMSDLPAGIVIIGRGAKLRGFNELLANNSKVRVRFGSPAPSIRVACASPQPMDALDVIAVLQRAALRPAPAEACVEEPKPVEPEPEQTPEPYDGEPIYDTPTPKKKKRGFFDRLFGSSKTDEEELEDELGEDDDLLKQEQERQRQAKLREEEQARREHEARLRREQRARQRRDEEDEEDEDVEKENNTFANLKKRIVGILEDPEKNMLNDKDK